MGDSIPEDTAARVFDHRLRAQQEDAERPPRDVMQEKLARLAEALGVPKKRKPTKRKDKTDAG